jgi:hypothetical protein
MTTKYPHTIEWVCDDEIRRSDKIERDELEEKRRLIREMRQAIAWIVFDFYSFADVNHRRDLLICSHEQKYLRVVDQHRIWRLIDNVLFRRGNNLFYCVNIKIIHKTDDTN